MHQYVEVARSDGHDTETEQTCKRTSALAEILVS